MLSEAVWGLPGPSSFVDAITADAARGLHTVAVLPRRMLVSPDTVNELAGVLTTAMIQRDLICERVFPDCQQPLLPALGQQLCFSTALSLPLQDLIRHPDVHGRVIVVSVSDLAPDQVGALPDLVRRLVEVSRPLAPSDRVTFAFIAGREAVAALEGGATADVWLASHWWWNRVTRWDSGAHVARVSPASHHSLPAEVRAEVIVEVARWDLELAEHLVRTWNGEDAELQRHVKEWWSSGIFGVEELKSARVGVSPPAHLAGSWDAGHIDVWHGDICVAAGCLLTEPDWEQLLWRAQARVLLPWIDLRRAELHGALVQRLGPRWRAAVEMLDEQPGVGDVLEVGQLAHIARVRLGGADPLLTGCANELARVRNEMAHLRPVTFDDLERLLRSCRVLQRRP